VLICVICGEKTRFVICHKDLNIDHLESYINAKKKIGSSLRKITIYLVSLAIIYIGINPGIGFILAIEEIVDQEMKFHFFK
jgi:hypothetical protein